MIFNAMDAQVSAARAAGCKGRERRCNHSHSAVFRTNPRTTATFRSAEGFPQKAAKYQCKQNRTARIRRFRTMKMDSCWRKETRFEAVSERDGDSFASTAPPSV